MSVAPMLQNLRIVHAKRQSGKRCPRSSVEAGQKMCLNERSMKGAAFFSSPENRCLPASMLKLEERELVVDSGSSMHLISKKDLNKAEMNGYFDEVV